MQSLNPETIAELYVPVVDTASFYSIVFDAYGYGHFIENLSNGYRAVAHGEARLRLDDPFPRSPGNW